MQRRREHFLVATLDDGTRRCCFHITVVNAGVLDNAARQAGKHLAETFEKKKQQVSGLIPHYLVPTYYAINKQATGWAEHNSEIQSGQNSAFGGGDKVALLRTDGS